MPNELLAKPQTEQLHVHTSMVLYTIYYMRRARCSVPTLCNQQIECECERPQFYLRLHPSTPYLTCYPTYTMEMDTKYRIAAIIIMGAPHTLFISYALFLCAFNNFSRWIY